IYLFLLIQSICTIPTIPSSIQGGATASRCAAGSAMSGRAGPLAVAHALHVDIDDEGCEQDEAADQDLQEAVDLDVIEPVVEHTQDQQTDDGVADAAAAAEQAGAAHHHGGDGVEQVAVEFVLLGAAEVGDAQHPGHAGADALYDYDGTQDQLDIDAGIFRRFADAAHQGDVAADGRVGQHAEAGAREGAEHDDDHR